MLRAPLPSGLSYPETEKLWAQYQFVTGAFLLRLGKEHAALDQIARVMTVTNYSAIYARFSMIPMLGRSLLNLFENHGTIESVYRISGEFRLMELSAAAGYRTFCLPDLVRGLRKTGKMKDRSFQRMMDTFDFLSTMFQYPMSHPRVIEELHRTGHVHSKYKVAGAHNHIARELFKYIALNMFYIGPRMRIDITPTERHAICGLTVLIAEKMGHAISGSVLELEHFIDEYEATRMFSLDDKSDLHSEAVKIAQASAAALHQIPTISPARIHGYVPYNVKRILQID